MNPLKKSQNFGSTLTLLAAHKGANGNDQSSNSNANGEIHKGIRDSWGVDSRVEVFSQSHQRWFPARVKNVFQDNSEEWLVVTYGANLSKQIKRNGKDIRPRSSSNFKPKNKFTVSVEIYILI